MQYDIRLIKPEEIEETKQLMSLTFEPYLRPIFFLYPRSTLVAVSENRIVGALHLDIYTLPRRKKMGYIGWLYTAAESRGLGIAGALVDHAIQFCREQLCSDMGACVEGDNPSSFGRLATRGFSPLSFSDQISSFGIGFLRVWKRASRFFDMGYTLWHRKLSETITKPHLLSPSKKRQVLSFFSTLLLALYTWIMVLSHHDNLSSLLSSPYTTLSILIFLAAPLSISLRTLSMSIVAKKAGVSTYFGSWDSAYVLGLALPILVGWPFLVPGNIYISGIRWKHRAHKKLLGHLGLAGTIPTVILLIFYIMICHTYKTLWAMGPIGALLCTHLVCDTICFFYPFSGFNASRIKQYSPLVWKIMVVVTILCCIITLRLVALPF